MTARRTPMTPKFDPPKKRGTIAVGSTPATGPPTVTINQGSTQEDPYDGIPAVVFNAPGVLFDVVFSESVTGFAASDIVIGGTASPQVATLSVATNPPHVARFYVLTEPGTVTASIPAGVATSTATGLPNEASTSTDNEVTFNPRVIYHDSLATGVTTHQTMAYGNGHLFLPSNTAGTLTSVDVSDPDNLFVADSIVLTGGAFNAVNPRGVTVNGDYAYVVSNSQLRVVDISDPANMVVVGTTAQDAGIHDRVVYDAGYCYTGEVAQNRFRVIDVSTPASPAVVGGLDIGTGFGARGIAKVGNSVLVSVADGRLIAVDVSTPSAPAVTATVTGSSSAGHFVVVVGDYAYAEQAVFDVSTPSAPVSLGRWNTLLPAGFPGSVFDVLGSSELVAHSTISSGVIWNTITIYGTSDPENLNHTGASSARVAAGPSSFAVVDMVVNGNFIYSVLGDGEVVAWEVIY